MVISLIKNRIESATDVAKSVATSVIEVGSKALDKAADRVDNFDVKDTFEKATGAADKLKDTFKAMFSGDKSVGQVVAGALGGLTDKLGLPEWVAPAIGAVVDFARMDFLGGAQGAMEVAGKIAESAGNEELADFLDNAQNVTGMFRKGVTQVGTMVVTGGAGATGVLAQAGAAGQLSQAGQLIATGIEVAGHIDKGLTVIDSLKDGDVAGAGKEIFGLFGESSDVVGNILGDKADTSIVNVLKDAFGGGGDIFGALAEKVFDGDLDLGILKDLPLGDLMENLGIKAEGFEAMAKPAMALFEALMGQSGGVAEKLGTVLAATGFEDILKQALTDLVGDVAMGVIDGTEFNLGDFIAEITKNVTGILDMASLDPEAAKIIEGLLTEAGSLNESFSLKDLQAAFLRP